MTIDRRRYIRVTVDMARNPKLLALQPAHRWLYLEALCHCGEYLTDGRLTPSAMASIGVSLEGSLARNNAWRALERAGLIEPLGDEPGYRIRDYLEHQESRDQVEQLRAKRQQAGSKGGAAKANAVASARGVAKQELQQTPSYVDVDEVLTTSARPRATPAPTDFEITEAMMAWARRNAAGINIDSETPRFLDHHRAKGSKFSDWTAAWRKWMSKAVEYASNGNGQAPNLRSVGGMTAEERYQDDQDRMAHRGRYKPPPKRPDAVVWSDELGGFALDGKLWEGNQ